MCSLIQIGGITNKKKKLKERIAHCSVEAILKKISNYSVNITIIRCFIMQYLWKI